MLISEAFNRYKLDVIVFRGQSRKTEENHEVALRSLLSFFGDIHIENLTFSHIRDWKIYLDKDRSPETVRNYVIKLRVVLGYLLKQKIECLDPEQIPIPKRIDKVPKFLTKEQVATLITCTDKVKNKAIISFLYASGLRVSELCGLDRGQIREDCSFTVVGKGGKSRLCFIDERTCKLLKTYLKTRTDNHPALFLTEAGKRITPGTIQETFKSVRKRSGLECSPHTLRHSFATNLLYSNTNLYYVQQFLGHANLQTTQQYLHVVNEDLHDIYREKHTV